MTLLDPEHHFRISEFLDCPRDHKESAEFLDLTIEKILDVLILRAHKESVKFLDMMIDKILDVLIIPPQDRPIFIELVKQELGLTSTEDRIGERL